MRHSIAVAALAVALSACADGKSVVTVSLDAESGAAPFDVFSLRVVPSDASGRMDTVGVPVERAIPPAYEFSLRFDASVRGAIHLDVQAFDSAGAAIGAAAGDVTVAPSKTFALPLTLRRVIGPPTGSTLAFVVQPTDAVANAAIKPPVQVAVRDLSGAVVTSTNVPITVAIGANPATGRLGGTATVSAVNGVATFPDLTIDMNGDGYTLVASAAGLDDATSAAFNVRAPVWTPASSGIFGGVVTALASDRGNPITMYAGTATSGVYKSTNLGQTWAPVVNGLTTMAINGLAVDPTNGQIVYATTDVGIWKTVNGGASWNLVYQETPAVDFYAIAIDPAAPLTVYAGGFSKVVKTTNGGAMWSDDSTGSPQGRILSLAVSGTSVYLTAFNSQTSGGGLWKQTAGGAWVRDAGMTANYPNMVAVSPTNANTILVATDTAGMWATTNGGTNWAQRAAGSPNFFAPTKPKAVMFDPSNGNIVYAASAETSGGLGGLWVSMDGGTVWSSTNSGISDQVVTAILVDKNSSSNVLIGLKKGVWKSIAGGINWFDSSAGMTALPVRSLATTATAGTLYAGTQEGGVFKTTDGGMNWGPASGSGSMMLPFRGQSVRALALDPAVPNGVYAALNRGGVWRTSDGGTSWSDLSGGGIVDIAVNALTLSTQNTMLLYAGSDLGSLYKTVNGGGAWTNGNLTGSSFVALVFDPTSASTIYAATAAGLNKTTNSGTMWTPLTTGLPTSPTYTALAIETPNPMVLYAGLQTGTVYRSADGGASWTPVGGLSAKAITVLATHPTRTGVAMAGTAGDGVWHTTDGGTSWRALNGGLESLAIASLAFDLADPTVVYAGTVSGGVYRASVP